MWFSMHYMAKMCYRSTFPGLYINEFMSWDCFCRLHIIYILNMWGSVSCIWGVCIITSKITSCFKYNLINQHNTAEKNFFLVSPSRTSKLLSTPAIYEQSKYKTNLPGNMQVDVMLLPSHLMCRRHFSQYQVASAVLKWQADGDWYLMQSERHTIMHSHAMSHCCKQECHNLWWCNCTENEQHTSSDTFCTQSCRVTCCE